MLGRINKLETFGSVDGPGVRFVVFMQGCPMRCLFCHNPETWDFKGDSAGAFDITPEDLLKKALRYKSYWGSDGGITVSGGEPLMQIDFLIEFFELAKNAGVHTCIDTSGVNFTRTEPYFGKFHFVSLALLSQAFLPEELHHRQSLVPGVYVRRDPVLRFLRLCVLYPAAALLGVPRPGGGSPGDRSRGGDREP